MLRENSLTFLLAVAIAFAITSTVAITTAFAVASATTAMTATSVATATTAAGLKLAGHLAHVLELVLL